ncbi:MAG: anti-sigma factor domain-containing protein [Actinomycetota bacterium]
MNCDEARAALLGGTDREAVEAHLAGCGSCRAEIPVISRFRTLLADGDLWEEPPAGLRDRIGSTVKASPSLQPRSVGRRRLPIAAGAAVAAIMAALFLLGPADPDWRLELVATGPVSGSSAVVDGWVEDGTTRMRIRVAGILPAPDGYFYEIWMTAPDGRHVSAGSFTVPGSIEAVVGVRRSDFPRIWITLEPADGDQGPSPDTYFDTSTLPGARVGGIRDGRTRLGPPV